MCKMQHELAVPTLDEIGSVGLGAVAGGLTDMTGQRVLENFAVRMIRAWNCRLRNKI
jgi:hypothetical protein